MAKRYERISKDWQLIFGFPHTDPALDLGEIGLAGVKHIAYFARHYEKDFRGLLSRHLERQKRGSPDYSFYDVAHSVSWRLFTLLRGERFTLLWFSVALLLSVAYLQDLV